jgi:hypothetical protein
MSTEIKISESDRYLEENRHGIICIVILLIGCLGGITVGYKAIENIFTLSLVIIPTMTTLSLLLAVSPMKWIIKMASVSVIIDVILLIYFYFIG